MSMEYEAMEVEKWVNLEDIADHLSVSTDTVRVFAIMRGPFFLNV